MRKLGTKMAALLMAGAMMVTPVTVQAADTEVTDPDTATGNIQGSGDVEAIVDKDVFAVVLPTVADHASTFDFILDPQEVIKSTNNSAYPGATFNDHTGVYFNSAADTYGKDSAVLTATNKSSYDVDITLSATASDLADATKGYTIPLSSDNTFANDKTTSLYLALVSGSKTEPLTSKGATITNKIAALPDAYEIAYDDTAKEYKYQLKASATGFETSTFNMTGACNKAADWTIAKDATPTVDVTWDVSRHYGTLESDTSSPITISYKGADPAAGSLVFTKPDGSTWTPPASAYSPTGLSLNADKNTLVLTTTWLKLAKSNFGRGTYSVSINGKDYTFAIVPPAPVTDTTVPITFTYTGGDPVAGELTFTKPDGSTWTPPATIFDQGSIVINSATKTVTLTETWLPVVKTNFGNGTYSVNINDKDYVFVIADQLPPPSTDTTTPIMFGYTGEAPTAGSLTFTKPDGSTWTPPETAYTAGNIVIDTAASQIHLTANWLPIVKSNYGVGIYSVDINGTTYKFEIE